MIKGIAYEYYVVSRAINEIADRLRLHPVGCECEWCREDMRELRHLCEKKTYLAQRLATMVEEARREIQ